MPHLAAAFPQQETADGAFPAWRQHAIQLLPATQRAVLILRDELARPPSQAGACPAVDSPGAAARHAILWVSCGRHVW